MKITRSKLFNTIVILITICAVGILGCGEEWLDIKPKGTIAFEDNLDAAGAERLAMAAYAALGNGGEYSNVADWIWGSVRSDDAYKGGAGTGDQTNVDRFERFFPTVDQGYIQNVWIWDYEWIERANLALEVMGGLTSAEYPLKAQREAEMRFLRAHAYFKLIILYKNVPWIDETTEDVKLVSNRDLTRDQLFDKIAADFQAGIDVLPDVQSQVGRASRIAAAAYLAKTRLYQAFEQDENNNMTNINTSRLNEVVTLTDMVINSGKHALSPDIAENFLLAFENGPESVFAVQYSYQDGTERGGRVDWGHNLNYSMATPYGCCWFHIPSQNLVNAHRTDADGLPLLDTFDDISQLTSPIQDYQGFFDEFFDTYTVDPRIDHTAGIPGHPFKYDPNFLYQVSFARAPETYGPLSVMREIGHFDDPSFTPNGSRHGTATNQDFIRYADVLLWKAEALIELGRQTEALPLINMIRARAKNSTGRTKLADGSDPSNYLIEEYTSFTDQAHARKALRFERRLEFATESPRFFDLVRWGTVDAVMNAYFTTESSRRTYLQGTTFRKNKDEYMPIPQAEIVLSEGLYQQNPGY